MWWLGAVRQQAITWSNVDQDLQHHMTSLGPNALKTVHQDSSPRDGDIPYYMQIGLP